MSDTQKRIELVKRTRLKQGVKWDDLAKGLPISGNSLRTAFARNSVNDVYLEHVERLLQLSFSDPNVSVIPNNSIFFEKRGVKFYIDEIIPFLSINIKKINNAGKLNELINAINAVQEINNYDALSEDIKHIKKILKENNLL